MEKTVTGQVSKSAADFYEEFFVPALFQDRTAQVLDVAGLLPGCSVVDVGCGTGVLTRSALARVGPGGYVAGVGLNDGMIATARRSAPEIDWKQAPAESLPFGDEIAAELRTPYMYGDAASLLSLFEQAGVRDPQVETRDGTARFPSLESWIEMDVKGWTLGDMIDEDQYQLLVREARVDMKPFVQADNSVAFSSPSHVVTAARS